MKSSRPIFVAFATGFVVLLAYLVFSWDRSNGHLPSETKSLITLSSSANRKVLYLMGHDQWFMNHSFTFECPPRMVAATAKTTLTKDKGWTVHFPDNSSYRFVASKKDAKGRVVCEIDYSDYGGDGRRWMSAFDIEHPFPAWRVWLTKAFRFVED